MMRQKKDFFFFFKRRMKNDGIAKTWLNAKWKDGGRWIATTGSNTSLSQIASFSRFISRQLSPHFPDQWSTKTTSFEYLISRKQFSLIEKSRHELTSNPHTRESDPEWLLPFKRRLKTSNLVSCLISSPFYCPSFRGQVRAERPYSDLYLRSN